MKVHSSDSGSRMRGWLRDRSLVGRAISATLAVALYSLGMLYLGAFHRSDMAELGRIIARAPTAILNRTVAAFTANPTMIRLDLSHRSYQKLAFKRERALEKRRLITSDDDWVSADLSVDDVTVGVKIRLKGDWLDHLEGEEWSFRVDVRGKATVLGMERFSLQKPKTRNYVNEWIFHRMLRREGLIALRYEFITLVLNGRNLGVYALEEHFDRRLIENNQRRDGPIVRFDEQTLFLDGFDPRIDDLEPHEKHHGAGSYQASPIKGFRTRQAFADSTAASAYIEAVNLLEAFRSGERTPSEIFDVEKLGTFMAVCDIAGAQHATLWHNVRFYLNPISGKLEPIGFDAVAGIPIEELSLLQVGAGRNGVYDRMRNDQIILAAYVSALERLSEPETLDGFFNEIEDDLASQLAILHLEQTNYRVPIEVYRQNREFVRRRIHPTAGLHAYLTGTSDSGNGLRLEIGNIQQLPIRLEAVLVGDSNIVRIPMSEVFAGRRASVPVSYRAVAVGQQGKTISALKPMRIEYRLEGTSRTLSSAVFPYPRITGPGSGARTDTSIEKLDKLDYVAVIEVDREIVFRAGDWVVDTSLRIPSGYRVTVAPGTSLDLRAGAYILSKSPIRMVGTDEHPVRIVSTDSTGYGLVLLYADSLSVFEYVQFENLSSPQDGAWSLTGALTFYESPVLMRSISISGSRAEDALNIIRSDFNLIDVTISGSRSDALDVDFSTGRLEDVRLVDSGNDGMDVSGSVVSMRRVTIWDSGDKGLSVGEASVVTATSIDIRGAYIGIAGKDLSTLNVADGQIADASIGIAVFQKKSEFGAATVTVTNVDFQQAGTPFLVETGSRFTVDGVAMASTGDGVSRSLYPNDSGDGGRTVDE